MKSLVENATAANNSEEEFEQLKTDREILRQIFPTGENRVISVFLLMLLAIVLLIVTFRDTFCRNCHPIAKWIFFLKSFRLHFRSI